MQAVRANLRKYDEVEELGLRFERRAACSISLPPTPAGVGGKLTETDLDKELDLRMVKDMLTRRSGRHG